MINPCLEHDHWPIVRVVDLLDALEWGLIEGVCMKPNTDGWNQELYEYFMEQYEDGYTMYWCPDV